MMETTMELPVVLDYEGQAWHLFLADYTFGDSTFTFHFYARTHAEAEARLAAVAATGSVCGMMAGWVDGATPERVVEQIAERLDAAEEPN